MAWANTPDSFMNGLSSNSFWAEYLAQTYGLFYTMFFGPWALGFDTDIYSDKIVYQNPEIYQNGQKNLNFNLFQLWKWVLLSLFHGMVIFFMVFNILDNPIDSSGRPYGAFYVSTINMFCMVHLTNLKVTLETTTIHWKSFLASYLYGWGTTILITYLLSIGPLSQTLQPELYGSVAPFYVFNLKSHLVVFFCPIICLIPDYVYNSF